MSASLRFLLLLVVALHVMSCVPPSCYPQVYGTSSRQIQHLVGVSVYSEPAEEPLERLYEAGVGMLERFERYARVDIDQKGRMAVYGLSVWPERCPRIPQDELAEVSRAWQPILDQLARPRTYFESMANPYTGDDWRAEGPHLEITFGSVSEKTLELMWDGRSSLPEELDIAVIATLEMVCSNSRLAKKYLLRDLPQQVATRLECPTDQAPHRTRLRSAPARR